MKKLKYASLFFLIGWLYIAVEIFLRVLSRDKFVSTTPVGSLIGWSSLWMVLVGGLAGFGIGFMDEVKKFKILPMMVQSIIGAIYVTIVELLCGLVLNKLFHLGIWDYSNQSVNLLGQISLVTSFIWLLITPACLWLDNVLRHYMYGQEKPEPLIIYYKKLITLK